VHCTVEQKSIKLISQPQEVTLKSTSLPQGESSCWRLERQERVKIERKGKKEYRKKGIRK
jgi:hypothetical protein